MALTEESYRETLERRAAQCTTHHAACDCGELKAWDLFRENERLRAVAAAARHYRNLLWAEEHCCQECADAGKQPSPGFAALDAALAALDD